MPNVTTASARGFAFDPRACSQLDWTTAAATSATGRHISRSTVMRFALAQVTERLSWLIENDNLDAARTYLQRLPEFARCESARAAPVADQTGRLQPWRSIAH